MAVRWLLAGRRLLCAGWAAWAVLVVMLLAVFLRRCAGGSGGYGAIK